MIKLFCISILIAVSYCFAAVEIRFNKSPIVKGGTIVLSDIAEITGDSIECKKLSTIEIGQSAKPGKMRIIQTGTLKQFFINPIVDLSRIEFYNEGKLEVKTHASLLTGAQIEEQLRASIEQSYSKNKMYEVEYKGIPESVPVPLTDWSLEIEKGADFDARGRELLYVNIIHKSRVYHRMKVQAFIKVFEDVVFSTGYIKRGSTITAGDLAIKNVETTNIKKPIVHTKESIIGKEIRRSLNQDRMILFTFIDEPFLVKNGDKTRIKTKVGSGFVYAIAIARENGREGDVVRVQNSSSKKMIRGTVDKSGDVWIIN